MFKRFDIGGMPDGGIDIQQFHDGHWVKYEDFAALQQERDVLATENAALKYYIDNKCYIDNPVGMDHIDAYSSSVETPATNNFLKAVRADAVVEAFVTVFDVCSRDNHIDGNLWNYGVLRVEKHADEYVKQLRAPKGDSNAE